MKKVQRFVVWICKHFNRDQIINLVEELVYILADKNSDIKPKDDFKAQHPNYRDFSTDPLPPLDYAKFNRPKKKVVFSAILADYHTKNGKHLKPVQTRSPKNCPPELTRCPCCNAPHEYIYYNDGRKRTQLKCKVCHNLFQLHKRFQNPPKYLCPYCYKPLFTWKQQLSATIYKCGNNQCSHRKRKLKALNEDEQKLRPERYSQFKVNYLYRDYHFELSDLRVAKPAQPTVCLNRIHNDVNIVGLILTLHISYAITARKTAHMLKNIWQIPVSYQTVLNYTNAAAHYCHKFNQDKKGDIDDISAGDETYVKVKGVWHYAWFFICTASRKIAAYHLSDNRGAQPAIATMLETVRTSKAGQELTLVTDGNPSYMAGLHFINRYNNKLKATLKKVIGLQNLDDESEEFRAHKQMIERLNRTYKYHVQAQNGFGNISGAMAKLVLFVTHYNFLRPHKALRYKTPIALSELNSISSIQGKWQKIISMAA